ncbi:MAG: anaerobic sulfatase maturase [Armatimonadota bacterium]
MAIRSTKPFHLMIKPTGAACNLACEYCYYLEKTQYYHDSKFRMDDETLERVIAAYLQVHPGPEATFGWQGGEPLLMGIDFFRRALELQSRYTRPGLQVTNAIQTNGTLVTDEWAAFFAEQHFLVGVSIDGPPDLHDRYRRDRGQHPTHQRVLDGLACLQRHGVEYNALVTVNRANAEHPLRVYQYLIGLGIEFLQFIPIVEREAPKSRKVTPWTVRPEAYGKFLCAIFDYWARHDVGRVYVQHFETALSVWLGQMPALCVFAPTCGRGLVVEHTGDLYACDHFVYPDYLRGPITTPESLQAMVDGAEQQSFGTAKINLSAECRRCPVLRMCGGDCPKHRLRLAEDGKPISYLCPAYREFFTHSATVLQAMAQEIRAGRPAVNVMEVLRELEG